MQLEEFGFCGPGEAKDFGTSSAFDLGGRLPLNTNGGQLGEAYIHGMNGITEGVRQIRGTSGNQVANVEHVLVTAGTGVPTSGLLLARRDCVAAGVHGPGSPAPSAVTRCSVGRRNDQLISEPCPVSRCSTWTTPSSPPRAPSSPGSRSWSWRMVPPVMCVRSPHNEHIYWTGAPDDAFRGLVEHLGLPADPAGADGCLPAAAWSTCSSRSTACPACCRPARCRVADRHRHQRVRRVPERQDRRGGAAGPRGRRVHLGRRGQLEAGARRSSSWPPSAPGRRWRVAGWSATP